MGGMPVLEWLIHVSNTGVIIGSSLIVQSTILITAGLCTVYLLRNKSVVVQAFILRAFLLAILLCPFVSLFIQNSGSGGVTIDIPVESIERSTISYLSVQTIQFTGELKYDPESLFSTTTTNREPIGIAPPENLPETDPVTKSYFQDVHQAEFEETHTPPITGRSILYILLTALWITFSGIMLFRLIFCYLRVIYIRYTSIKAEPEVIYENNTVANRLGIVSPPVLRSMLVHSPFLTGIFKPVILLPEDIQASRAVLIHEQAHLARHDCFWNLVCQICKVLFPMQPLIRIFTRAIDDISDYVCDDYVVKFDDDPRSYAFELVTISEIFQPVQSEEIMGMGIIPYKSSLRRRIERILDSSLILTLKTSIRQVLFITFFSFCIMFVTGFIGFEGKHIIRPGRASENLLNHLIHNEEITALEEISEPAMPEDNNLVVYSPVVDKNERIEEKPAVETDITEISVQPPDNIITAPERMISDDIMNEDFTDDEIINNAKILDDSYIMVLADDESEETFQEEYIEPTETRLVISHAEKTLKEFGINLDELTTKKSCVIKGEELLEAKKYFAAVKVFHRALELEPNDAEINNYLGRSYMRTFSLDKAEMFLKIAIAIKPDYADAHYNLSRVLMRKGHSADAMKHFGIASNINNDYGTKSLSFF